MGECLGLDTVTAFVSGTRDDAEALRVETHLAECAHCRALVSALAAEALADVPASANTLADGVELALAPTALAENGPDERVGALAERTPLRGARVGRYVVEGPLGAGGMGIVLRAHDPELGRWVALKMVRRELAGLEAMLGREARAMAQLSHPNVVRVYDVLSDGSRLFVTMEYIEGVSLKTWLDAEPRPWHDVIEAFIQAGRGLSAAHNAGIVHRDFKPQNVLVDERGRVCVTDFGLARVAVEGPGAEGAPSPLASVGSGGVGTPAYMAPEQHRGGPADSKSDQFAFCVSLYQALFGELPFAGDSLEALASSVRSGDVRPPPAGKRLPAFVHPVLLRGLRAAPEERYPSMDALLADLGREPLKRLRRGALGAAMAIGLAAVGVVAWQSGARASADRAKSPPPPRKSSSTCGAPSARTPPTEACSRRADRVPRARGERPNACSTPSRPSGRARTRRTGLRALHPMAVWSSSARWRASRSDAPSSESSPRCSLAPTASS